MAAIAPNFLDEFQQALDKINAVQKATIDDNVTQKNEFVNTLFNNLKDINARTKHIYSRIQQVIDRLNALKREHGNNDDMIARFDAILNNLQDQIRQLNDEKSQLIANIQSKYATLQKQHADNIAALNAQVQTLTQQNEVLKKQAETLQQELANRPGQEQNAAALKELGEKYEQQIQQAAEANQRQIEALNQQIAEETQKNAAHQANIDNISGQIKNKDDEIAAHQKNVADITTNRDGLVTTNADLENRIRLATEALQKAEGYIQNLLNRRPSDLDQQEYTRILGEIQQSLQEIDNIIPADFPGSASSGSPGGPASGIASFFGTSSPPAASSSPVAPDFGLGPGVTNDQPTSRTARTNTGIPPRNATLPVRQGIPGQGNLSNQAPGGILGSNVNDANLGGKKFKKTKKTKKIRKQRGGFIYKNKKGGFVVINQSKKNSRKSGTRSRRRSSRSSRSTRSSSRTTSRNSVY
jgi:septal ring factor EnvC (AmiA/AmiB activator)